MQVFYVNEVVQDIEKAFLGKVGGGTHR